MKIKEISVSYSEKLPHPVEEYFSIQASVVLTATVQEDEDYGKAVKTLQSKVVDYVQRNLSAVEKDLCG